MNQARRSLVSTTALVAAGAALTACAAGSGPSTAAVEQVIANVQGVLSYLGPLVPALAVFVPAAAAFVPLVESGLSVASDLLNTLSSSMTAATAQPIVKRISVALDGALDAADKAVALVPNPTQRSATAALLKEARVIAGLLEAFVTGSAAVIFPTAVRATTRHVHVRQVR